MFSEPITSLLIAFGALFLFLAVIFIVDRKVTSLASSIPDDLRIQHGIGSDTKIMFFIMAGVFLSGISMDNQTLKIIIRTLGVALTIFCSGVFMKAPIKILFTSAELPQCLKSYSCWAFALSFLMLLLFGFNISFKLSH